MAESNEAARLRNLQKFHGNHRSNSGSGSSISSVRTGVESSHSSLPDSALTAFLQLVALRLNKQRALVSLVDEEHQVCLKIITSRLLSSKAVC